MVAIFKFIIKSPRIIFKRHTNDVSENKIVFRGLISLVWSLEASFIIHEIMPDVDSDWRKMTKLSWVALGN